MDLLPIIIVYKRKVNEKSVAFLIRLLYYCISYMWENAQEREACVVHKDVFRFTYALNYVFQVTVCMITPAALWIGLGWLCCNRWGMGRWAMILAILLGVGTGVVSMFRFLMASARLAASCTISSCCALAGKDFVM